MAKKMRKFISVTSSRLISAICLCLVLVAASYSWKVLSNSKESVKSVEITESDPYSGVLIAQTDMGQGSCFTVVYRHGYWYAVTAAHVVDYDLNLTVDEELYKAEIVRIDSEKDIALIRFKSPENYKIYSFDKAKAGEFCTTVGWNQGSRLIYKGYVVSTDLNGQVAANGGVLPGCSGGVLLNQDYNVIGITVAIPTYNFMAFDSTALYVPSRFAAAMVVTIKD